MRDTVPLDGDESLLFKDAPLERLPITYTKNFHISFVQLPE